jgi:hypothetical protein
MSTTPTTLTNPTATTITTPTYTPPGGLSPQAQQLNSLTNELNVTTPGAVISPSQADTSSAKLAPIVSNMQNNQAQNIQNTQNSLQQSSGLDTLTSQYSNLVPAFQMFLADQNLSSKYMNNVNPNLYANPNVMSSAMSNPDNVLGIADPNLASAAALSSAVTPTPPPGGGFAGFSDPTSAYNAASVPIQGVNDILNLLQSAINTQTGKISSAMGTYDTTYGNTEDILANLQKALETQASTSSTSVEGSKAQADSLFDGILDQLGPNATPSDVWSYINVHDTALRGQGVDVDELWALQKDLANKNVASISTGKVKAPNPKDKVNAKGQTIGWTLSNGKFIDASQYQGIFGIGKPAGVFVDLSTNTVYVAETSADVAEAQQNGYYQLQ